MYLYNLYILQAIVYLRFIQKQIYFYTCLDYYTLMNLKIVIMIKKHFI